MSVPMIAPEMLERILPTRDPLREAMEQWSRDSDAFLAKLDAQIDKLKQERGQ